MREILFRGKDNKGIYHYGNLHIDTLGKEDKYYINSRINVDSPDFIEVDKDSVGQSTEIPDIDGDDIYEGHTVRQVGAVTGDNTDFTGTVEMLEGCWVINNHTDNAIPLWSETRENKIIDNF